MTFQVYQWLVPLIALVFILRTIWQYRIKRRSIRGTVLWLVFWLAVSLLALLPDWISINIAQTLGFKSNVNAIIFLAIGGIYIFVFYLSSSVRRVEWQLTELIRELAKEKIRREKEDH